MKYDCPHCQQSLAKMAEQTAKAGGPEDRPSNKCPSCGGMVAHRICVEEVASLLLLAATIFTAWWWLDGKPIVAIIWVLIGVVAVTVPFWAWVNSRLRNAQRYKRASAI